MLYSKSINNKKGLLVFRNMSDAIDVRNRELSSIDSFVVSEAYRNDLRGILISEGEINSRIEKLGEEIAQDYSHGFIAYCVLDGAMKFFTKLLSYEKMPHPIVRSGTAKSYGTGTKSSKLSSRINFSGIRNREVLLVEDIVDSGKTLSYLITEAKKHRPKKLSIACLLDKPSRREEDIEIDYVGFIIPDEFVVGYGMDFNDRYRYLNHLGVLKPEIYK